MTLAKIDDMIAAGANRATVEQLPSTNYWPQLANEGYHGLAGRIVDAIAPYSEADPVAILAHVLVGAGNAIGRGVHATVESTSHPCNEFVCLVGQTSKGRKGQAWSTARGLLHAADPTWAGARIRSGLSSGEGLIFNVRDERHEMQPIRERGGRVVEYQDVLVDSSEPDKRLLVIEPELATVLRRMQGESNTLSAVLREAWESGRLATLTKNSPLKATGAHVSLIAHITPDELTTTLTEADRVNGFANRFLFLLVRRAQCLPDGAPVPAAALAPLAAELRDVLAWAAAPRCLVRDPEAREIWAGVYPTLSEGEPGLLGAVLGRAEAHVLRLSVLYAALDRAPAVRPAHLAAALALWDFAEASARRIFGHALGIADADRLVAVLRARGPQTRTAISAIFGRNRSAAAIDALLHLLVSKGRIRRQPGDDEPASGRRPEIWEAV